MTVVVLARHGETGWSSQERFTGWADPPLTLRGEEQASRAGHALRDQGVVVERAYTSALTRAERTARIMLAASGAGGLPAAVDWRINERHLGRLQGMTKCEVTDIWGRELRRSWRDDAEARPPALHRDHPDHPCHDPRYDHVPAGRLPGAESRHETAERVLEFWHERVIPDVVDGRNVLVVAHLGPLRALADHLKVLRSDRHPPSRWDHGEPHVCTLAPDSCCDPSFGRPRPRSRAC